MTKVPSLDYWRRFIEVTRVNGKGTFTKIFGEGIVDDEGTLRLMMKLHCWCHHDEGCTLSRILEKVMLMSPRLMTNVR